MCFHSFYFDKQELQRQSEEHLEEARKLEEQLFKELPSELLASRAQEELSELALLRSTLPQQLQERGHYLGCAQALRRDYWAQRDALVDWLDRSERIVAAARDGVDLDGLDARCKELRVSTRLLLSYPSVPCFYVFILLVVM